MSPKSSRVFVVQEVPGRNMLDATRFGTVEVLLPPEHNVQFSAQPTVRHLRHTLRDITDQDYVLLSGDPVAIGVACAVAATLNVGLLRILKWDRQSQRYFSVEVNVNDKPVAREVAAQ